MWVSPLARLIQTSTTRAMIAATMQTTMATHTPPSSFYHRSFVDDRRTNSIARICPGTLFATKSPSVQGNKIVRLRPFLGFERRRVFWKTTRSSYSSRATTNTALNRRTKTRERKNNNSNHHEQRIKIISESNAVVRAVEDSNNNSNNNSDYAWALVGCDSDAGGALAIIRGTEQGKIGKVEIVDVPTMHVDVNGKQRTRLDVKRMIEKVKQMDLPKNSIVFIEEGGVEFGFSAQTAFVQGYNFGLWKGVLESCVNETTIVEVVKPQAWKLALGLRGKASSKDDSIDLAKLVFPEAEKMLSRKKDHGRAESLLIAAYGHARETLQANKDIEYADIVKHDSVCKRVFDVLEQKGLVSENGVAYFGPYFGRTGLELKHDLKQRGLKVSGTKGELILRLETDDLTRRGEKKKGIAA